jgi:hypothetical protein
MDDIKRKKLSSVHNQTSMKQLSILAFAILLFAGCKNSNEKTAAEKTTISKDTPIIDNWGIDSLKLGMQVSDLEKLVHQQVPLKNVLIPEVYYQDTVNASYRGMDVTLYVEKQNTMEENKFEYRLAGLKTTSPMAKTAEGIGVGSDKLDIIRAYDDRDIRITPDYTDTTYTVRDKTRSFVFITNSVNEYGWIFYVKNGKVAYVELINHYSDAE